MKIKKNNDILDLLEIYDGVLIDWELHSKKIYGFISFCI